MRKTEKGCPVGAEVVKTYRQLYYLLDGWKNGELGFLIIIGPPGPGKSTAVEKHLGDDAKVIKGGSTPWRFYTDCYANVDKLLVLDDADKVFKSQDGANLIKHLTQTAAVKQLQWNSNNGAIAKGEVPAAFYTTSRCVIISNSWKVGDADFDAITSRGHLIFFNPTVAEMVKYAATWVEDVDVWEFVSEHLKDMENPDLRLYWKAQERKALGERRAKEAEDLDDSKHLITGFREEWKHYVLTHCMKGDKLAAWKLLQDTSYPNDRARAQVFTDTTGKVERTFYRYAEELRGRMEPQVERKDNPEVVNAVAKLFQWPGYKRAAK